MKKWVSTKWTFGKQDPHYHTVEECRYLQSSNNYRVAADPELEWHEAEECENCEKLRNEA